MLSENHWRMPYYSQRMTVKEWKEHLLNERDRIIFHGKMVRLIAKRLGYGVVEVSKEKT